MHFMTNCQFRDNSLRTERKSDVNADDVDAARNGMSALAGNETRSIWGTSETEETAEMMGRE